MTRKAFQEWALAAVALLGLACAGRARAAPVRMLAPESGGVVTSSRVLMVFAVPEGTRLLLDRGGRPEPLKAVPAKRAGEDVHHLALLLPEGTSRVRLLDAEDRTELAALSLTRLPARERARTGAGRGDAFHTPEREASCGGCHPLPEDVPTVPGSPEAPAERICNGCHRDLEDAPFTHGPAAVYACFACHDPKAAPARFAPREEQPASCSNCHADVLAQVLGGHSFAHGPVAVGQCTLCHGPHGGETSALLRATEPGLCLGCHGDTLPRPAAQGLHGRLSCSLCHGPHGGATPGLTQRPGNPFCTGCHAHIDPAAPGHPIAGHPVAGDAPPRRPDQPLGCVSCHPPHGLRDISKLRFQENAQVQRRFCTSCHS